MSELTLKVENFQAISEANIKIDGITVLSGNNSTGKSTLSKMLYYVVKTSLEYESVEYDKLSQYQYKILERLSSLMDDYSVEVEEDIIEEWKSNSYAEISSHKYNHELFLSLLDISENIFLDLELNSIRLDYQRINRAISFPLQLPRDRTNYKSIAEIFIKIRSEEQRLQNIFIGNTKNRPLVYLDYQFRKYFKANNISVSLFEEDTSIIDRETNRLNNVYSVNKVFYNDTPISMSFRGGLGFRSLTRMHHWDHILQSIIESSDLILTEQQIEVNKIISTIISGKVSLEDNNFNRSFTYTRASDNLSIELADSATGIMSFAILQLLLSKGLLDENTLLILDEPEAHLHPQWIVEYARVLVLLNKKLGVKFMLATHSPDMVSALRYISEQEETLDVVKFYLASKDSENNNRYNYKDLDKDIEPIFESFNIALDRIAEYGV